jgi:hypothetical protein
MKRNLHLIMLTLVGLLCGSGQLFKMGAQTRSVEKNAFTPNTIPYGPAPAFVPLARSSPCSRVTRQPLVVITLCV